MGTIDASSTSTVLMALAAGDKLSLFYEEKNANAQLAAVVTELYEAKWTSADLKDLNFFTASLVFRALGILRGHDNALLSAFSTKKHQGKSYEEVIDYFKRIDPAQGKVGGGDESKYPLTSALVYWFFDAAEKLGWTFSKEEWMRWAAWASAQFHAQLSFVAARDDAAMDPVALAMSACLVSKIHGIADTDQMGVARRDVRRSLPARNRAKLALIELFKRQGDSGIWPKYFPLFVYPDGRSVNHCFAFELMEALLCEFPDELVDSHFTRLERTVAWCENHRIVKYLHEDDPKEYFGWNSGANLAGLQSGYPECWATAVVHMFLFKLAEVLTTTIQSKLLVAYGSEIPKKTGLQKAKDDWDDLAGSHLSLAGVMKPVKDVLEGEILEKWNVKGHAKKMRKRSALLFGPPGTSKTSLVKKLAAAHEWPCVSINPSHFLEDGLEEIFGRANRIFEDLMDLSKVVVFFDEMDPLVQKREAGSDIHHQSLTTVFLPKLADLYNHNEVIFFMATNHIQQIDPAIRRPGRFDYLLFVGPPRWTDKYESLTKENKRHTPEEKDDLDRARALLASWTAEWQPVKCF